MSRHTQNERIIVFSTANMRKTIIVQERSEDERLGRWLVEVVVMLTNELLDAFDRVSAAFVTSNGLEIVVKLMNVGQHLNRETLAPFGGCFDVDSH